MLNPEGQLDEGVRFRKVGMLDRALEQYEASALSARDPAVISEALTQEADVYRMQCEWDRAVDAARRAAEIARDSQLTALYAAALSAEAAVHQARGDLEPAAQLYEQALNETGDDRVRGIALQNLGTIAALGANLRDAERLFWKSLRAFRRAGYAWGEAFALNNCAALALDRGRAKLGRVLSEQAMTAAQRLGDYELLGVAAVNCADALTASGELAKAESMIRASLEFFTTTDTDLHRAECLRALGDIALRQGEVEEAARHYSHAAGLAQSAGADTQAAKYRDCLTAARAHHRQSGLADATPSPETPPRPAGEGRDPLDLGTGPGA
jgi:tetratricopeptide (TPR) repeat protein